MTRDQFQPYSARERKSARASPFLSSHCRYLSADSPWTAPETTKAEGVSTSHYVEHFPAFSARDQQSARPKTAQDPERRNAAQIESHDAPWKRDTETPKLSVGMHHFAPKP